VDISITSKLTSCRMKAILFVLLRAFELEPAVPLSDVARGRTLIERPFLKTNPNAGNTLPVLIKRYLRKEGEL
jgi:hypothetical protein